eukprot:CAMPEP_0116956004 /NCGR_PEP_ID=MMETSP0467-20121206/43033_1 /TAXON_ID=283647 /ORGANISM="Mesodinium pulex, Strain SPMC105" /LENGTH=61 /DNA_ID=CAMNT_0004642311 /DNA_START=83 /DNA_END=265 /DNA_ORIENTATION=-
MRAHSLRIRAEDCRCNGRQSSSPPTNLVEIELLFALAHLLGAPSKSRGVAGGRSSGRAGDL